MEEKMCRCQACDHPISLQAKECPSCGHQMYVTVYGMFFFAAFYLVEMQQIHPWAWPLKVSHVMYMLSLVLSIISGITYNARPKIGISKICTYINYLAITIGLVFQHIVYIALTK